MNRIWNSIVGKLWATILLLVSFVLFIVTVLLLEFLDNFHTQQAENTLRREATTIGKIVLDHQDKLTFPLVIQDILDEETNAIITDANGVVTHTFHNGMNKEKFVQKILEDAGLTKVNKSDNPILKEMILPSLKNVDVMEQYIVIADPYETESGLKGTVYIYQSLDAIHRTTKRTTHIVLLSAFIAFVLTTFFAFFLSTKITSPLRKMRQAAFELSKGNFDTKLPVSQGDEIGQLAVAFNQMGRQLKSYVELINHERWYYLQQSVRLYKDDTH